MQTSHLSHCQRVQAGGCRDQEVVDGTGPFARGFASKIESRMCARMQQSSCIVLPSLCMLPSSDCCRACMRPCACVCQGVSLSPALSCMYSAGLWNARAGRV